MMVTLGGIVMPAKPEQKEKALTPRVFTLSGIVMFVIFLQERKA
jgi:hypothetical protein